MTGSGAYLVLIGSHWRSRVSFGSHQPPRFSRLSVDFQSTLFFLRISCSDATKSEYGILRLDNEKPQLSRTACQRKTFGLLRIGQCSPRCCHHYKSRHQKTISAIHTHLSGSFIHSRTLKTASIHNPKKYTSRHACWFDSCFNQNTIVTSGRDCLRNRLPPCQLMKTIHEHLDNRFDHANPQRQRKILSKGIGNCKSNTKVKNAVTDRFAK